MRNNTDTSVLAKAYKITFEDKAISAALTSLESAAEVTETEFNADTKSVITHKWILLLVLFWMIDNYLKKSVDSSVSYSRAELEQIGIPTADSAVKLVRENSDATTDYLDAKIYFAISRIYTLCGKLTELCDILLIAYRTAALNRADMSLATLINQLVQAYLANGDYKSAIQFTQVSKFPEDTIRSTPQLVRCMFNLGRIQALQLNYAEALELLHNAINKLPPDPRYAFGFKLLAYKFAIVAELLTGEIPSILLFRSERARHFRPMLTAYESLVLSVRNGDMTTFDKTVKDNVENFRQDGTLYLVERLHHAVQRAALRKINVAYNRISIKDIAETIGVSSARDAESIVAKAIVDGIISGHIDAANKCLVSTLSRDESGAEAAETFSKRIMFCTEMFTDAHRALQYPEEETLKARAAEAEERRKQQAEERSRAEEGEVFEEDEY